MRHTYLLSFSLATMMQHALEKIPSVCMMNILPHPPDPKDDLTTFLDSLGGGSAPRTPAMPAVLSVVSAGTCNLTGVLDTGGLGMGQAPPASALVFGGVPSTPLPASALMGISLFQSGLALPLRFAPLSTGGGLTSNSAPAAVSTPKVAGHLLGYLSPFLYHRILAGGWAS